MAIAVKQKPKETPTHRKRQGVHQRRSHHFVKTYWPYIPLLLIISAGILLNSLWFKPRVLGYATNLTPGGLFANTNEQRTENGLGALTYSSSLTDAAQAKANDMVTRDYWSHTTPDGQEPWVFINQTGYLYEVAGENLAYGFDTSANTVTGWMNSPGHRANILNINYTEVGFGIANSASYQSNGQETVVVAMYAKPVTAAAAAGKSTPVASQPTANSPPAQTTPQSAQSAAPTNNSTSQPAASITKKASISVSAIVPGQTKVARVQLATSGTAPWSTYAVFVVMALLAVVFLARHSVAWHRRLRRGEQFILHHKFLDIVIVVVITAGVILTQTVGFIQ